MNPGEPRELHNKGSESKSDRSRRGIMKRDSIVGYLSPPVFSSASHSPVIDFLSLRPWSVFPFHACTTKGSPRHLSHSTPSSFGPMIEVPTNFPSSASCTIECPKKNRLAGFTLCVLTQSLIKKMEISLVYNRKAKCLNFTKVGGEDLLAFQLEWSLDASRNERGSGIYSQSPSGGMVKGNVRFWLRDVFAPSPFLLVGTSPCSSQSFLPDGLHQLSSENTIHNTELSSWKEEVVTRLIMDPKTNSITKTIYTKDYILKTPK
ncbi:hypothetical protein VNO80_26888 [Phaseolus coccineus]|uniref:Uncharacterized protein n=1 Tax=Phaseolus coccineus TaxID=3886 RepID=A0AAN9LFJ8_PHACN